MRTECIHSRPRLASIKNTDSESDADSDADMENVVVDESADSVVWDADKQDSGHLETCQTMLVEYGNKAGDGRRALNIVPICLLMSVGR